MSQKTLELFISVFLMDFFANKKFNQSHLHNIHLSGYCPNVIIWSRETKNHDDFHDEMSLIWTDGNEWLKNRQIIRNDKNSPLNGDWYHCTYIFLFTLFFIIILMNGMVCEVLQWLMRPLSAVVSSASTLFRVSHCPLVCLLFGHINFSIHFYYEWCRQCQAHQLKFLYHVQTMLEAFMNLYHYIHCFRCGGG